MTRAFARLACAALLASGAAALLTPVRGLVAYGFTTWWNDSTNIVMDDVFLPAATWSSPAQFQLSEWNEVDTTDNSHPFRISASPQFSFGANDGDNTMGFLGEAGLNSEYGLSYASALAWTACWSSGSLIQECDMMLDPTLPWNLSPDPNNFFQSTVLHESGHIRGLDHENDHLSMQNAGGSVDKILRGEVLYMDDKVGVRQHASHVAETDIVMYNKWHDGAIPRWMSVSPTTARVGQTVNFNNITVENRGTTAFGNLQFGIYFSTNEVISTGDQLLNTGFWNSFGTFTLSTFNWSASVPTVADCGTRYFGAIIDHPNAYAERYEANNDVVFVNGTPNAQAFNILLERDSQEPNDSFAAPRIISLPFSNSNLTIDQDAESDYYRFTLAALSRVTFTASFTHASGDVDMDLRNNSNAVLQSSTGTTNTETITRDLAAGTYYLRVYGYSGSSGSCNRYSLSGSAVLLNPDIDVSPASWAYGSVLVGASADRVFTVTNTGNIDLNVSATSLVGVDPAQFSIQAGGGAFTLAPSATRLVTVRFAPTTAGAKTASLRFASDDPNENPKDVPLSGTGVNPPDLRITAVTPPANVAPGTLVNVQNTVFNGGTGGAGAFTVGLYLSVDNVCTAADTFLASRPVGGLAAGVSSAANTPVTIPAATPLGTRYVCVIADTANTVVESAEGNNTGFRQVNVVSATPTVNLKVNGVDLPTVTTAGPAHLTLDIAPSTWTTPLDWYWAIVAGGTVYWVTPGGLSTVPAPLTTAVPGALTNVTLLNLVLPPGTSLTSAFFLVNGATLVSSDVITINVTTTLTSR